MAPIEELAADVRFESELKLRKTGSARLPRPSTPTPPAQLRQRQDSSEGKANAAEKETGALKSVAAKPKRIHRSKFHHLCVASCFIGFIAALALFQNQIKETARPAFDYVENTLFARVFFWALLFMIPEPSPVVVVWATWVAWGNFDSVYKAVSAWVCESYGQFFLFHGLLPVVVVCIYYFNGLFCLALEMHIAPEWLQKYRIQTKHKFDAKKLPALLRQVTFNFMFVVPPVTATYHRLMVLRYDEELPGPMEVVCSIFSYIAANEVYFYYVHSLMHRNKTLYGLVHKVHHEYKQPVALASLYAHPLEVAIVILGQFTIGPILFGGHFYTIFLWTCSVVMVSQTHHCGFHWPWIPAPKGEGQPEFHDLHHEKFNVNYGSFEFKYSLDGFHGTLPTDPFA